MTTGWLSDEFVPFVMLCALTKNHYFKTHSNFGCSVVHNVADQESRINLRNLKKGKINRNLIKIEQNDP